MSTPTHYIATTTDHAAIWGLGTTAEAAIDDALHGCADMQDVITMPCTNELAEKIDALGGEIAWDIVDGVACCE